MDTRDKPPLRLPLFVREEIGFGDAVKRVTSALGIAPCGGCSRRAESLNRRVVLTPRRRP
ncbi:MAG TPA: hypothetical protein VGM86_07570 [Thermoanaerobaculia bacterium]|jgi:hypothetical protein